MKQLVAFLTRSTLLLFMTGCATLAPEYQRPEAPVPASWPSGPAYPAVTAPTSKAVTDIPWREFFVDSRLRDLIALALSNNRDLRVSTLNIERAQAQYQIRRADLFPRVDASASGNFQRIPEDFSSKGQATTVHQYSVGLGVSSYELDLFGRVASLKEQALEQYLASEQARTATHISLVAQVATGWLTVAADRERLQIARATLKNQESYLGLIQSRHEAGISSALELNQARTLVESARLDVARYTTLVAQDENLLALLIGGAVPAGTLPDSLSDALTALKDLSPGVPSETLLKRPDILQAEQLLKAANANIGAARAAFFPKITLVSSVGFGSNELAGLFTGGAFAWSFAPRISLPIFDAGSNRAGLEVAEADRKIAVAHYEKTIQTAFREVADALAQRGTIEEQVTAQKALTAATAESSSISQARYEKGIDSYLNVLDSQRSLYTAQQNLISIRLARLTNLVTLYKALGGGWER